MAFLDWLVEVDVRIWLESFLGQGLTLTTVRKESENPDAWLTRARDGPGAQELTAVTSPSSSPKSLRQCVHPACWLGPRSVSPRTAQQE